MSSGTAPPPPQHDPTPPPPPRQADPYEALIDQRVRVTQRQVKGVDIATGLMTLAVGSLAYLFVAALIDHWVVPGGLGVSSRLLLFLILAAASLAYFVWRVLPLLVRRINPLFAAYTIEQSRPSLKNSLINLLFLRGERTQIERDVLSQRIFQGLERTAAADLSRVSADAAVDHSQVIHRGYLLAGILAISAVYLALSPKSPLTSFGRVVFPWAGIHAPTRVTIDRVEPGDAVVYQGDYVTLSAELHGLNDGEQVLLYYSTADGQSVNQAVPMTVSEGEYRHRCQLPPGPLGMQQQTTYYLKAGDCTTEIYRLDVQPALSIRVDSLDYHYPEYTGLNDRRTEREGDVRAIEGTRITVHATASHPIQQATIEMDCKSQFGLRMTHRETAATGQFTLAVSREHPGQPEHASYQVRFRDAEGREDRRPTRYRIDVIPDLPPDVKLIEPPPDGAQFPVNGELPLRVRAEDPDFALRSVVLRMEVAGKSLPIRPLLNQIRPEKPHQGPFEGAYRFQPAKLGLKVGDTVVYLAEATDNKEPLANRTRTQARRLVLVPPQDQKSPQQPSDQGGQGAGQGDKQSKKDDRSQQSGDKEQGEGPQEEKAQDPDKRQADPSQSKDESMSQPNPQNQDQANPQDQGKQQSGQEKQSGEQNQKGGEQNQGGKSGEGDSSASQESKGQSGQSAGKQGESSSQQSGQKGQGDQSQSTHNQGQSQDGSSTPSDSQDGGQADATKGGSQPGQRQRPVDGTSNPGDVFEKALARRAEEESKADGGAKKGEQQAKPQNADGRPQDADGKPQNAEGTQQNADGTQKSSGDKPRSADGNQQGTGGKPQNAEGQSESSRAAAEPAPRDSQQKTDGKQQDADSKPQNAESMQPTEADKPQNADDKPQNAEDKSESSRAATDDSQPNGDEKRQDADGKRQNAEDKPQNTDAAPNTPSSGGEPGAKGGDQKATSSGATGERNSPQEDKPSPVPQENGGAQPKNVGPADQKQSETQDSAKSTNKPPRDSNTQGDMGGDRPGEGDQGSGQSSKQAGNTTAGSHSPAEQGGAASDQQGKGETGTKAGDQAKADHPTGQSAKTEGAGTKQQADGKGQQADGSGENAGAKADPSRAQAEMPPRDSPHSPEGTPQTAETQPQNAEPKPPSENKQPPDAGNSAQPGGRGGAGNPVGGGTSGPQPDGPSPSSPVATPSDPYNREFAEKQTTLALEYLKDQLAKEKPDSKLLDQLGWNRQDLEKFVSRWEAMRRAAVEPGPSGEAAKRQFDEALKSLGLRPRGTVLRGGQTSRDQMRSLKEAGRFEPPPEWSELLRAYNRGVAGSQE